MLWVRNAIAFYTLYTCGKMLRRETAYRQILRFADVIVDCDRR
ncbi:MAG: hypothetical protein V7K85_29875 [Nostoc sp.]